MHVSYPMLGEFEIKKLDDNRYALATNVTLIISALTTAPSAPNGQNLDRSTVDQLEQDIDLAGQKVKQGFFAEAMRILDRDIVLNGRHHGSFARRGTRSYTFKTSFGTVSCPLIRVRTDAGVMLRPSVRALGLPARNYVTTGLRNRVCDLMVKVSVRKSAEQLKVQTGEEVLRRTKVWELANTEGEKVSVAVIQQSQQTLKEHAEAAGRLLAAVPPEETARAAKVSEREAEEAEAFAAEQAVDASKEGATEAGAIGFAGTTEPGAIKNAHGPRRIQGKRTNASSLDRPTFSSWEP